MQIKKNYTIQMGKYTENIKCRWKNKNIQRLACHKVT